MTSTTRNPIERTESGAIICTGEGIAIFQLLAVRGALKLEKLGLKSRGGSIRKGWALRLGLKASAKHDEVIAEIDRRLPKTNKEA